MALSSDIVSQLVKAAKPAEKKPTEATVYGTAVEQNGNQYVQLDGSSVLTPVSSAVRMKSGERVIVRIKDHTAVVTGNLTTQAARSDDVDDIIDEIAEFEIVIADKVSTGELDAERARIDALVAENATITGRLEASEAIISELEADNVTINGTLTAHEADIKKLSTEKLDAEFAEITYATIANLNATNAQINNLEATYGTFVDLTTEQFEAIRAEIDILDTTKLSATDADLKYANIDFANIGEAAIRNFFAQSGIIEDLVVSDGNITGTLTSVEINADYITTGTLKAERLILLGEDGLFHEINLQAGELTEGEVVPNDSLHGSVITAKSITATQILVDDLIAFDATIGGFNIGANSLYSGVKESIDNSTRGVYLDTEGQVYIGDADNFLRYRKRQVEKLAELAPVYNKILAPGTAIPTDFSNPQLVVSEPIDVADCKFVTITAWACVNRYAYAFYDSDDNLISGLTIADNYNTSTGIVNQTVQVPEGAIFLRVAGESTKLKPAVVLIHEVYRLEISAESIWFGANSKSSASDLKALTEHIKIGTYADPETGDTKPCVEMAEGDSDFKMRLTNKSVEFMDGVDDSTTIDSDGVTTENVVVKHDIRQQDFIWRRRSNGNYGLMWMEVTE